MKLDIDSSLLKCFVLFRGCRYKRIYFQLSKLPYLLVIDARVDKLYSRCAPSSNRIINCIESIQLRRRRLRTRSLPSLHVIDTICKPHCARWRQTEYNTNSWYTHYLDRSRYNIEIVNYIEILKPILLFRQWHRVSDMHFLYAQLHYCLQCNYAKY